MAYSDLINASIYKDLLGADLSDKIDNVNTLKSDYSPVNPYSSGAYSPRSSRNIYTGVNRDIADPVKAAEEGFDMTKMEKAMLRGGKGLEYMLLANKASPYLSKIGSHLGAKAGMGTGMAGLGPAALLYGATRNENPYDFTKTERLGTIGSTVLGARSLAPMLGLTGAATGAAAAGTMIPYAASAAPAYGAGLIGPAAGSAGVGIAGMHPALLIGSLILGNMFAKKQKKAAKRRRDKAYQDYRGELQDVADTRAEAVEENRKDMANRFATQQHLQRQGQYDNQYGGNYDARMFAEKGMKMPSDIVAEFTGNELIVNDQEALEKDLAKGNVSRVATRIKKAMKEGKITPGPETHKNNPMPVDNDGNIYAGGGALPFKVKKGAGIYDHATDQFKEGMTDKEIAMTVKKNMIKWKKNNMA